VIPKIERTVSPPPHPTLSLFDLKPNTPVVKQFCFRKQLSLPPLLRITKWLGSLAQIYFEKPCQIQKKKELFFSDTPTLRQSLPFQALKRYKPT
jgi:hypothetical protein